MLACMLLRLGWQSWPSSCLAACGRTKAPKFLLPAPPPPLQVYAQLVGGGVGSPAAQVLFHTQYHRREKSVTAALGDW